MEKNGFNYGVVVDDEGYYLQAVRWRVGTDRPQLNRKGQPRVWLLISEEAVNNVQQNGRWNKETNSWEFPTEMVYTVNERGNIVNASPQWPQRRKGVGPKEEIVTKAPPKNRGRRPIWDGNDWKFPMRVGLVNDATGELEDVQLENPRKDQPNVLLPAGYSRVDEKKWPVDVNGNPINIGHILDGGEWKPPEMIDA